MDSCSICGGELVLLGSLGDLTYGRCRCCGADQTYTPDDDRTPMDLQFGADNEPETNA